MSQWKTIFRHLTDAGYDVYSPGQHEGECISPYVVVRDAGMNRLGNFSSTQNLYDILCYVPKDQFSTLEPFVEGVKETMKGLYPGIVPMDFQTASFLDDTVKGHMISVQYRNNRKITRR